MIIQKLFKMEFYYMFNNLKNVVYPLSAYQQRLYLNRKKQIREIMLRESTKKDIVIS